MTRDSKKRMHQKPAPLRLVVRDAHGKIVSTTDVWNGHSLRYSHQRGTTRSKRVTLQIAWDDYDRTFTTIDCKACNENDWKIGLGTDPTSCYDIQASGELMWRITCRKCGAEFSSGGGPPDEKLEPD